MAFDLSTAQPVAPQSGNSGTFDLSTATPVNPPAKQPSGLDHVLSYLNALGKGVLSAGPAEAAMHLGSGAAASLGGGLGYLSQLATTGGNTDSAKKFQEKVQSDFTYQPRTKEGKALASAADKALGAVGQGIDADGSYIADKTGSPALGAAFSTGVNAIPMIMGLKGARGTGTGFQVAREAGAPPQLVGGAPAAQAPTGPRPAPTTPSELLQQSLDNGTAVGYQATPNWDPQASFAERLGQGIAGKNQTEQAARVQNQGVTNALGARAIDQPPASLVTQDVLKSIRQAAVDRGYAPIQNLDGVIPADAEFLRANAKIRDAHSNELSANPDVEAVADKLNRASFDPKVILDYISTLRTRASDAFDAGRSDAGTAFRKQAAELESLLDRHLQEREDLPSDMLTNYRASRQLIAKTHSIGDNLNPATGNIDAAGIARLHRAGTPLDGDLKRIADFANSAPGVTGVPQGAPLPTSPFNTLAGAAAAHATGGASMALIPAARAFAARWLLKRNEHPAYLNPVGKTYGQSAIDAVHGSAPAFGKLYGSSLPPGLIGFDDQ